MNPIIISVICLSITFLATTLGSSVVFFTKKKMGEVANSIVLGFASGIMFAAAIFGLIVPSITDSKNIYGNLAVLPVVFGFLLGGGLLYALDRIIPHINKLGKKNVEQEGIKDDALSPTTKFFLAVTIHNIPEGLAVGFACGLALSHSDSTDVNTLMMSALGLAIGIAIQNFPEGLAVSLPLYGEGNSKAKSFWLGTFSGIVEPIFAFLAILLSNSIDWLMPWLLAFAGGAMVYAVVEDLMPNFQKSKNPHFGIWSLMFGFAIMMVLEITLS
ncbi:MAG: ZIP family metal transporter [Bacilli bacterium]